MRDPDAWNDFLKIEPAFLELQEKISSGVIHDFHQIPPEAFAWHGWELVSEEQLFRLVLPFLKAQLGRAQASMPEIYGGLAGISAEHICGLEDWHQVPILLKDDDPQTGQAGFRKTATADPLAMRPRDLQNPAAVFGSGGSTGSATPTFVTAADRRREIQGWRRGWDYHGLAPGDTALYTYNTTHKGGQWMQESLWAHGLNVMLRRPEEGPERVLENLRAYQANILLTVQPPQEAGQNQSKAAGINLASLIMASLENPQYQGILIPDSRGRKLIEFIFLGGFEIVPYALELDAEYLDHTPIATLLGSSEAIPQAASTNPHLTPAGFCHYNNLHLLQGPHYVEIVKCEGSRWMPVSKGQQGLVVYTSWARDGTLRIRYAPGDVAVKALNEGECPCGLKSPVIANVHRQDPREQADLFIHGCASG